MNTTIDQLPREDSTVGNTIASSPAHQAYWILKFGFTVAPILAGLDKFFHLLVNWDQYLPGVVANISPIPSHTLMLIVGVIEIVAGIGVALKPRIFAYVVAAWLAVIIINLLLCYCSTVQVDLSAPFPEFASVPPAKLPTGAIQEWRHDPHVSRCSWGPFPTFLLSYLYLHHLHQPPPPPIQPAYHPQPPLRINPYPRRIYRWRFSI